MSDQHRVTVRFLGVPVLGGGRQYVDLSVPEDLPVLVVLQMAVKELGQLVTPEQLQEMCMILVQGQNIADLQGWDTPVFAGNRVSVVPLVGGG